MLRIILRELSGFERISSLAVSNADVFLDVSHEKQTRTIDNRIKPFSKEKDFMSCSHNDSYKDNERIAKGAYRGTSSHGLLRILYLKIPYRCSWRGNRLINKCL